MRGQCHDRLWEVHGDCNDGRSLGTGTANKRQRQGLPELQQRYAALSNNTDAAKLLDFTNVLAWILDEFEPHDASQQQFMSESILKVLLTPKLRHLRG